MYDDPTVFVSVICLASLGLALFVSMSPPFRFKVAGGLAVPLFFLPGLPLSVGQICFLLMGAVVLVDRRIVGHATSVTVLLSLVTLATLLSTIWSPDIDEATGEILRLLMFSSLIYYAVALARQNLENLDHALAWAAPWLMLQAILVIAFRLSPDSETAFLQSRFATVIVGPFARSLFNGSPNNVLDPVKSGGLFVNANVASMYGGISLFVLLILYRRTNNKIWLFAATFVWASVFFTGSKTGIALAIAMPVLAFLMSRLRSKSGVQYLALSAVVTLPATLSLIQKSLLQVAPGFSGESENSYATRTEIWTAAASMFEDRPLYGLGFGGWEERIGTYIGRSDYPPHNILIDAWSKTGIIGVLAVSCFLGIILIRYIVVARSANDKQLLQVNAYGMAAWSWVFIHGMGDNTGIYGEWKSMFLLATLIGYQTVAVDLASRKPLDSQRFTDSSAKLEGLINAAPRV
ncbi:O-antigen ligase family protein [Rhodococcus sp. A14]|uniref:O-antigen ligase family protein n=1 Tax=Rhodococcus sp. A14 TaxID=1194106 RepID=UPI001423A6E4|nr:O-antigen ligase family protein [Rhodococcus sp. A14]